MVPLVAACLVWGLLCMHTHMWGQREVLAALESSVHLSLAWPPCGSLAAVEKCPPVPVSMHVESSGFWLPLQLSICTVKGSTQFPVA